MARRPHRISLAYSVEKFCLDLMLSVLPIIFIWRFHRVAQDQRILDSELDTEVTYHKIIYFSTGPPWFWSLCKVQMRINLFKCSWFCLSPLQRPLCVEGRLGRRKNESARGTWDTRREVQSVKETVDAFRSIQPKLSKIWKQRQMVQTFSGKVSRSSGSCWISKMRTIQSNILEIQGTKMNGNFWEISENLSIPREVFLFFGNFAKCCSIRHWKLSKIQTERFGWMEIKAPSGVATWLGQMRCEIWMCFHTITCFV